jgi:5-methylcytosine-specific restriction endonuclease McrA
VIPTTETQNSAVVAQRHCFEQIVLFSKNYLPITRVNLRRAVNLMVAGKAVPLDLTTAIIWEIRSPSIVLQVPNYLRLTVTSGERIWRVPAVSRRELLRRDKHQCQYCGSNKHLTIDHIFPRSRGGKDSWENLAIACAGCNSRKGNRTPEEAGMHLKTNPKAPMHPALAFADRFWSESVPL